MKSATQKLRNPNCSRISKSPINLDEACCLYCCACENITDTPEVMTVNTRAPNQYQLYASLYRVGSMFCTIKKERFITSLPSHRSDPLSSTHNDDCYEKSYPNESNPERLVSRYVRYREVDKCESKDARDLNAT